VRHDLHGGFAPKRPIRLAPTDLVRDASGHSSLTITKTYLHARADSLDHGVVRRSAARTSRSSKALRRSDVTHDLTHGDASPGATRRGNSLI
jgi:hypothetical protein